MAVIGFFDSGIGGLTVMHEARKQLPFEQFLYFADTDHVPYGTKTTEEIYFHTRNAADFLLQQGAEILVIACNTATSVAITKLREELPIPIVGMEPAVKPAARRYPDSKILVCATPRTIEGDKLHHLLENEHAAPENVHLLPLPMLVNWAEEGRFDTETVVPYLRETIPNYDYTVVVLGCTHFTLFRDSFRRVLGEETIFIDGTPGTVKRIKCILDEYSLQNRNNKTSPIRYFQSGREVQNSKTLTYIKNIYTRLTTLDEYIKL